LYLSSGGRHTRSKRDWSSDVCSSDLELRRQRLVVGDDECGLTHVGNDIRHREGFARGGDAEEGLLTVATAEAFGKPLDRLGLVEIGRASCRESRGRGGLRVCDVCTMI